MQRGCCASDEKRDITSARCRANVPEPLGVDFSYDSENDIAYIRLFQLPDRAARILDSVAVQAPEPRGDIVLDFNAEGHLAAIEIMNARSQLPPEAFD
jgi:uncharacterized protein YuzE